MAAVMWQLTIVEMKNESVVGKVFECFVMMPIHVALQEIKDGGIHQIGQSTTCNCSNATLTASNLIL